MRVTAQKTIDVQIEVDVDLDEVIAEWFGAIELPGDAVDGRGPVRRIYSVLDSATKLLAKVPDAAIDAAPYEANCEMVRRLEAELARYKAYTEEQD